MSSVNSLFRKRIGIPEDEKISFEMLSDILERTSTSIPFENLCVIENKMNEVNKENLIDKMLVRNEGGLCYELNSILYFFLIENGFDACLARGVVFNLPTQKFLTLGRTHVTIIVNYDNQTYLVDTGFGANIPLKPVPFTGETVISKNGEFRVKNMETEHGDYVLELKLKHKDIEWRIGYAFNSSKPITDVTEFNEIQKIIAEHKDSPFNKNPLITRFTNKGNIVLSNSSFTQWKDGVMTKDTIDHKRFKELAEEYFGLKK